MQIASKDVFAACTAADHYSMLYGSLSHPKRIVVDLSDRHLSHAFYYQLCKIKYAAWKYRVDFRRTRRHSLADIFQDLVAFYLRVGLPENYEVSLEVPRRIVSGDKVRTIQPDICVKRDGKMHFVLEAKTNIGWARPDFKSSEEHWYDFLQKRIDDVSSAFEIPSRNVIYVFEEPTNVSTKHFLPKFWDAKKSLPAARATTGMLAQVFPLFMTTDPWYWDFDWKGEMPAGRDKQDWYPATLSDQAILGHAQKSVVTPFESILMFIQQP